MTSVKNSIIFPLMGQNSNMIKTTGDLSTIKREIFACRDKEVVVRFNPGRNKIVRFTGVLSGAYPEIFTVRPDDKNFYGKTTYSYTEVLCGEVKVSLRGEAVS